MPANGPPEPARLCCEARPDAPNICVSPYSGAVTGLRSSAGKPIPLTQTGVDREARLRADDAWLQKAWADPNTRVIVVEDSQALMRTGDGAAELIFIEPGQAPDGIRFFLGLDPEDVAYFGVIGTPPEPGSPGAMPTSSEPASARPVT